VVPGSQIGFCAAIAVHTGCHAYTSSSVRSPSTAGTPALCVSTWRSVIDCFPFAANSGQ
jgi:hypothetical protein